MEKEGKNKGKSANKPNLNIKESKIDKESKKDTKKSNIKVSEIHDNASNEIKHNTLKNKTTKLNIKKDSDTVIVTKGVEFSLLEVIIIILITGIVVSIISGLLVYNNYEKLNMSKPISNIISSKNELSELEKHYKKIINEYVEEVDKKGLIESAIGAMYNYVGDPYTMYMDKDDSSSLEDQLNGEYTGIGVEIYSHVLNNKSIIEVNKVFKNSPAEKAGLKAGDLLIKLDDVSLEDKDALYVSSTIKDGKEDTHKLTIIRDKKEIELTIKRENVYIDSVHSKIYDNVGYLQIDTFSATTVEQVKKEIDSFDNKVKSLVIDLRDNTGGFLQTAEDLSNLFIEKGKNIYQIKNKAGNISTYKSKSGIYRNFDKIAVIVNGSSASASEILALALKESAGAIIVGTQSYGKGTVQETSRLESGAMVKYTTSYWLSPNGNLINKVGITPDKIVEDSSKQIDEAIKVVK